MPPHTQRTAVNKGKVDTSRDWAEKQVFEAFEGPSRPRLIYKRPGVRELPKVRVSNTNAESCIVLTICVTGNCSVWWDMNHLLDSPENELN